MWDILQQQKNPFLQPLPLPVPRCLFRCLPCCLSRCLFCCLSRYFPRCLPPRPHLHPPSSPYPHPQGSHSQRLSPLPPPSLTPSPPSSPPSTSPGAAGRFDAFSATPCEEKPSHRPGMHVLPSSWLSYNLLLHLRAKLEQSPLSPPIWQKAPRPTSHRAGYIPIRRPHTSVLCL